MSHRGLKRAHVTQFIATIDPVENRNLKKYLEKIGPVSQPLNPQQEYETVLQIKKGDPVARERLIKANLRFVAQVAKQYMNSGIPIQDLIAVGNLGLIAAIERFDETRGFKFISCAIWSIRAEILLAIKNKNVVNKPHPKKSVAIEIESRGNEFHQTYGCLPSTDYLIPASGINPDSVERLSFKQINEKYDGPENLTFPAVGFEYSSIEDDIASALAALTEREQEVIKLYYGINTPTEQTLEEIGNRLDLTRERVRQIRNAALKKLKKLPQIREYAN